MVDDVAVGLEVLAAVDLDDVVIANAQKALAYRRLELPRSMVILSRTVSFFSWIFESSFPLASSRMNVSRIRAALPFTLKRLLPSSSSIQ